MSFGPEIKIIKVEIGEQIQDIGAAASKQIPIGNRYRYFKDVNYTLENGVSVPSRLTGLTKPKLQERIDSTKNNIDRKMMFAQYYDHGAGPYWSLVTKYYIAPR